MDLFMSYGKYLDYSAPSVKCASFDKGGLSCLLAETIDKIDNFPFKYCGLVNVGKIEKEIEAEARSSGIDTIASKNAGAWIKTLCGENPKLRDLAKGFILSVAMKTVGMPYKIASKTLKCQMPKAERQEKKDEMGFVLSFDQEKEATVVKKISLGQNTNGYEVGYFLCSAHNSALRQIIKFSGMEVETLPMEKKDMKRLAEAIKGLKISNDLAGFVETMKACSSYGLMPFATQRQFLDVYKDLPKPRRMGKINQPVEAFI